MPRYCVKAGLSWWYVLIKISIESTLDPDEESLCKDDKKLYCLRKQVTQKDIMIFYTDAVVDPRTMMIVSFDTSLAYNTMSTSPRSYNLTFWAQTLSIKRLKKAQKLYAFI